MIYRKFAVVKLWPNIKAAEDECLARLKNTARALDLECLEVDSFGRLLHPPFTQVTSNDVDFVLHLHFDTPKRYDIFSFVALWNPLQFYHDWGYRRTTRNLLSHDDFLSCSSTWADDHVRRSIARDPMRADIQLHLYHSLSSPILAPTLGDNVLFYAGINWERLNGGKGRHHEFMKMLDESSDIRIYGPKLFQNVDVWGGYKSYVGPIPFDGVSMIRLINKAGISLVLSSKAHRQSELMSNRLFESLAAGAVIICDENPFARRHFGDTLLYIDTTLSADDTYAEVQRHLDWIKNNPAKALTMAQQAQSIFRRDFMLDSCLKNIYAELPQRKRTLECLYTPKFKESIAAVFMMPHFDLEVLNQHIESIQAQRNSDIHAFLAIDEWDVDLFGDRIRSALAHTAAPIEIMPVRFFDRYQNGSLKRRYLMGRILSEILSKVTEEDYCCIVGPNERLFSDHCCSLLRRLQDCGDDAGYSWADMLLQHKTGGNQYADLADDPDVRLYANNKPIGFGRFLLRRSAFGRAISSVLPYLDVLPMHLLTGISDGVPTRRGTIVIDIQHEFNIQFNGKRVDQERELLIDYDPDAFKSREAVEPPASKEEPIRALLDRLSPDEMVAVAKELAHKLPPSVWVEQFAVSPQTWVQEWTSSNSQNGKKSETAPAKIDLATEFERMSPPEKTKVAVELAHSVPFPKPVKRLIFGLYRQWFRSASPQ